MLAGFIISLGISCSVHSQNYYEWGDPFPLTDSLSDNANPCIYVTGYDMNADVLMFWERSIDTTHTEIWMDNIMDNDPPEVVLADSYIHYTHPKVLAANYYSTSDSLVYLLYQTDQNGNQDIYFMTYHFNGTFSDPQPFATSPDDESQLSVGRNEFYDASYTAKNLVAWISNGYLFAKILAYDQGYFFTEAEIIDSATCSSPSVMGGDWVDGVLYQKSDSSGSYICESFYNYDGYWMPPEVYYDSTDSENPTRASYYYWVPCWSTYIDSSWRIMIGEPGYLNLYNISSPEAFDPAVMGVFYGVKQWYYEVYIAITYPDNGVDEIFMTNEMGSPDFANFSNSGTMNRNPHFFIGEGYQYNSWCWHNYLVWESFRNGHWQIWAAKYIMCGGSVDEIDDGSSFITAYPNPFTNETTLEFKLDTRSKVAIEIYDNRGMQVATIANRSLDQGTHQLHWDGGGLAAGIYIIKMTVGDMIYTSKVIKSP